MVFVCEGEIVIEALKVKCDGSSCVLDFGGEVVVVRKLEEGLV